jgi:hypothetical protein
MSEFIKQGDTVRFLFPTRDPSTGASVDAAALPVCTVYKDGTSIGTAGSAVSNKSTGLYEVSILCTSGNGYTIGSDFSVAISCTVNPATGSPTFGVGCIADFRITARDIDDVATKTVMDAVDSRIPAILNGGRMESFVGQMGTTVVTASSMAVDAISSGSISAAAVTKIQNGLSTAAAVAAVQADTDDIQTRLPTALVSGKIDASVGSMITEVITSAAVSAAAVTKIQAGLATAAAVSGVASSISTVSAQVGAVQSDTDDIQTRLPVALVSGRIDASIGAAAANSITAASIATDAIDADAMAASALAEIAAAVWAQVIESTFTAADMFRGTAAVLFGKVTDFTTGILVFRNLLDTKNRITVTTGATGRTVSTVNDLT